MHLSKTILFAAFFLFPFLLFAQSMQTNPVTGAITNLNAAKFVKFNEEAGVEVPAGFDNSRISYSKIKGSPFWKDEWNTARLYSNTGYVGSMPVRINLATGELHFLKNGEELILTDDFIAKVIFENDSAVFLSRVPNLLLNKKPVEDFIQVLNPGKYQLLKYTKRNVGSADSLFRTMKRYFFTDDVYYFIKANEKVERIKKLGKENVLSYLPSSNSYEAWIKENDIDFKKEKDIVRFLDYYNSKQ